MRRCEWANENNPLYLEYHDTEWGLPLHDEVRLFEMLILEGAQAGLSWETVLKKRASYRTAFDNFDPEKIACYTEKDEQRLLADKGIIRNRLKIKSAIRNAKVFLKIQKECGSFDAYIWAFVKGAPIQNNYASLSEVPARTALSDLISADFKKRGMNFVGSTIIYAYMQAIGIVNDHVTYCCRHDACAQCC